MKTKEKQAMKKHRKEFEKQRSAMRTIETETQTSEQLEREMKNKNKGKALRTQRKVLNALRSNGKAMKSNANQ